MEVLIMITYMQGIVEVASDTKKSKMYSCV